MNRGTLKPILAITAVVLAVLLSLACPPSAMAGGGGASGKPGVVGYSGGGMILRGVRIKKLEMEVIQARLNVFQADLTVAQLQLLSGFVSISSTLILGPVTGGLSLNPLNYVTGAVDLIQGILAIENAEFSP